MEMKIEESKKKGKKVQPASVVTVDMIAEI